MFSSSIAISVYQAYQEGASQIATFTTTVWNGIRSGHFGISGFFGTVISIILSKYLDLVDEN